MGRKTEPLTGGLVTDRDPALLKPGQLSDMRNMVYRNGAAALERAAGRTAFVTVSSVATSVNGLRDISFDNGDRYLVSMAGTKYRYSTLSAAPTATDLATIASGTSLEVVQYRNRFFLMNGARADSSAIGTNVVAYLSATANNTVPTTRQHGMLQVNAAPSVSTAAGAFSQTVTGYYEYWTTEIARLTQDGAQVTLESAFSSDNGPSTVLVSATGVVPVIQLPTIRNSITTGWRIYRGTVKTVASDKSFPTGFMIAELTTAASAHADSTAVASASSFPASVNSGGNFYVGFASASSMFSDNGVYASGSVGAISTEVQQGVYNFSLGSFSGVVKGIAVEVQGYVSTGTAPAPITVSIGQRRFDGHFVQRFGLQDFSASKSGLLTSTNSAAPTTITLGSSTDRWFPTDSPGLADTDFDANFLVVIATSKPNTAVGIDYVKVFVYYGASVDSTVQFPAVVYTFGDITSQVAKNFPPPSANTGDVFQDSLVTNDVLNRSLVRYSFPGEPEYFPPTYFIDFETRENDYVRAIRTVNNRLMVGLDSSLWRINYLPSERDSSFDRGKAIDVVSRSYGIVNPMCCCNFTVDGESEQLAFISNKGLHTTDGFNFLTRSRNQNWRNFISLLGTSTPIALINDQEKRELLFYYRNDTDANGEYYMCLHASYDKSDIDGEGNFKFSGPVHMQNYEAAGGTVASLESAWTVNRTTGNTTVFLGYGNNSTVAANSTTAGAGKVYQESGTTIPAADSTCQYTTRRIYAAGLSGEWMLDDLYGYCGSYAGSPIITYTFKGTKTNDAGETTRGTKNITLAGGVLHHVSPKVQVEGLRITMQATATTFEEEMLVLGSTTFGLEDAR